MKITELTEAQLIVIVHTCPEWVADNHTASMVEPEVPTNILALLK